jgi:hypothetical protein
LNAGVSCVEKETFLFQKKNPENVKNNQKHRGDESF